MSEIASGPGPEMPRRFIRVGVAVVAIVAAAGALLVNRERTRRLRAQAELVGRGPALEQAAGTMGEMSRGLADGGTVSSQFVSDLRAARWHEAYRATSAQFHRKMDEVRFEQFVKDSPELQAPSTPISFNVVMASPGASISFSGSAPKGGAWLLLTSEQGTLKVDRLALGEKSAP